MTISNFTRLTGFLLVAGFFYSCSSTQANLDDLLANNNYQEALETIDSRLAEDPSQPHLYIKKGEINAELAKQTDPELRMDFYTNTSMSFNEAVDQGADDAQISMIDSLRQQYWKNEHNAGLRASDNEMLDDRYHRAKIHFQNAVILRDDAVSSLQNLSIAHFNLGELEEAISSLKQALEVTDEPTSELYENVGYLYLEKGEPKEAEYYYELANKNIEEDLNLAFGLINAYIANDNNAEASAMLETLVDEYPQNAKLRIVYGTQLYEITSDILGSLKEAYEASDTSLANQLRFEAEGLGEEAESQLIEAFRRDTANTEYLESLAVFYNNLSAQYLTLTRVAFDGDKDILQAKAKSLINFAIDYYNRLLDIDANNGEYMAKLDTLNKLKQRLNETVDN